MESSEAPPAYPNPLEMIRRYNKAAALIKPYMIAIDGARLFLRSLQRDGNDIIWEGISKNEMFYALGHMEKGNRPIPAGMSQEEATGLIDKTIRFIQFGFGAMPEEHGLYFLEGMTRSQAIQYLEDFRKAMQIEQDFERAAQNEQP